jgi:hypothetical protein
MAANAREQARENIVVHQRAGTFLLKTPTRQFEFREVDNVSITGTGLSIPARVKVGTPVTMTYIDRDWKVSINGTVIWCQEKATEAGPRRRRYRVGIRFSPDNRDANTLFFLALREFIDPFSMQA